MTMQSQPPVINLEGVTRVFETTDLETHALSEIQLSVFPGEFVAVAGPSGCGKSTLLAILGLLDSPTKGRYQLMGSGVEQLGAAARARVRNRTIGFIFQSFNLIGDLTVLQNTELPLSYRGVPSRERRQRAIQCLERVGMDHRASHYPAQLSGGQQQRVAVARALVTEPKLLLADEPTGNLDSHNGEQVMTLLGQLHAQGSTICMVTHDPRFARVAGRTVHMFDGRIVEESHSATHRTAAPDRKAAAGMVPL
jgi:putative ABC transport system ATP-binding protein